MPEELTNIPGDIATALDAGKQLGSMNVVTINGVPCVMTPRDMAMHELHDLMENPARIQQTINVDTAKSFVAYFNEFAGEGSAVLCDVDAAQFVGIIDYHTTPAAGWCQHKVIYTAKTTKEWDAWKKADGVKMDQIGFAFFIEQKLEEIIRPEAAKMMEIALTLKAKTKLNFESGHRLDNGQVQIQYREEIDSKAGIKGDIQIPETFGLGMRIFEGGAAYEMEARFRYRIREGKVAMWYDLVRPHKAHRAAIEDEFQAISTQVQTDRVYQGRIG